MKNKDNSIHVPDLFMSANWSKEDQMVELFTAGLSNGVRGFDTAREYKVERSVGRALRSALERTSMNREDIFVQTRINNEEIIKGDISDEIHRSLDKMGFDYLDCFMFHWPTPDYFIPAWKKLEKVFETEDIIKSIGICNCRLRHLEQLEKECTTMPHILQVEVTPFWQLADMKAYCDKKGIIIQAFSPLCKMIDPIRNNETLLMLARKYKVSVPQIILRWNYQRGIKPISLSSKIERVKSIFDIYGFEIDDTDMQMIAALECGYKYHLESASCSGF